jgi:cytosine/adenosine deaminase-related metal-dependent hydrolase
VSDKRFDLYHQEACSRRSPDNERPGMVRCAEPAGGRALNRVLGGPLGVIKEGAYADIILVDGDPTTDIRLLMDANQNIDLIIKDGKIYRNTL